MCNDKIIFTHLRNNRKFKFRNIIFYLCFKYIFGYKTFLIDNNYTAIGVLF